MTDHAIRPGQVYTDCDPRGGATIRITDYTPGSNRADVVDATTGKRPRQILVRSLHDSATTRDGKPRRTGYRLVRDAK
ncbi:hypothetical protein [Kitasatospora sp. NPDC001683]